jgi:hypothetical protein
MPLLSSGTTLRGWWTPLIAAPLLIALPGETTAATVAGRVVSHEAPGGAVERCVLLARMPGGVYREEDEAEERALCAVDFYAGQHALCPKLFSTSPGTLVYDISASSHAGDFAAFEAQQCGSMRISKKGASGAPISFKMSMNGQKTSATFSTASLLYYHFSRYLDADIDVPPSVYRSMDRGQQRARVTRRGVERSSNGKGSAANREGWKEMDIAEANPAAYRESRELFTEDRSQVYGVLLRPRGKRYGAEVNGTGESGWGKGRNRDFQQTAPFLALRADEPLQPAIQRGLREAEENPTLRKAMKRAGTSRQMVFWMKELTEITLLDYIFNQQDRVGNIDYESYWYWLEGDELRRRRASGSDVPEDIAAASPLRLMRSRLNDNDAGGRVHYTNFTSLTGMVEKIRHFAPSTYGRLITLSEDFQSQGPLYEHVRGTFGLDPRQLDEIVENTRKVAAILRESCRTGALRFDLDPDVYFRTGGSSAHKIDCDAP